jgi:HEAT repeat protein
VLPPGAGGEAGQATSFGAETSASPAASPTTWFDWHLEPLLRVEARARDSRLRTAGPSDAPPVDRAVIISQRVVPALLDAYASSREPLLSRSILFGLARLGEECDKPTRARVRATLEGALVHSNLDIALAATVALGVYATDDQATILSKWLTGGAVPAAGKGGEVSSRQRACAALALALLGRRSEREDVRRFAVHHLAQGLQRVDFGDREVDAACALGLGIVPLREAGKPNQPGIQHAAASREEQVEVLLVALRSRDTDRATRAHAAISIGRIFDGSTLLTEQRAVVIEELVDLLGHKRRAEPEVLQSVLLALGQLADADADELDVRARKALQEAVQLPDPLGRGYALIGLATAGGRKGGGADPFAGSADVQQVLIAELKRGRSGAKGWAALGLGLFEHARLEAGLAASSELSAALAAAAHDSQSSSDMAAIDLARGLTRDTGATKDLALDAFEGRDPIVRAAAALALGLAGARSEVGALRLQLADLGLAATVVESTAVALVLLDVPNVAERLLELVRETGSLERQAALLEAIGRCGDEAVIEGLLKLLAEPDRGPQSRALVVRALSRVADAGELPWSHALVHGANLEVSNEFLTSEQGLLAMARW